MYHHHLVLLLVSKALHRDRCPPWVEFITFCTETSGFSFWFFSLARQLVFWHYIRVILWISLFAEKLSEVIYLAIKRVETETCEQVAVVEWQIMPSIPSNKHILNEFLPESHWHFIRAFIHCSVRMLIILESLSRYEALHKNLIYYVNGSHTKPIDRTSTWCVGGDRCARSLHLKLYRLPNFHVISPKSLDRFEMDCFKISERERKQCK